MILCSPIIYSVLNGRIKTEKLIAIAIIGFLLTGSVLMHSYFINDFNHYFTIFKNLAQSALVVYLTIFTEGMICSKYNVLEYLATKLNLLKSTFILLLTFILRVLLVRIPGDSVFDILLIIPFVLSSSKILSYTRHLKEILVFFGRYSTYMWYSHPYFYAFLFYDLVLHSDVSLFVYLQVVIYSLLASIAFSFVESKINNLCKRIFHDKSLLSSL